MPFRDLEIEKDEGRWQGRAKDVCTLNSLFPHSLGSSLEVEGCPWLLGPCEGEVACCHSGEVCRT